MLKLRVMGTKKELERFKDFLSEKQAFYEVEHLSGMYKNKGTGKHLRMYAELGRPGDSLEDK